MPLALSLVLLVLLAPFLYAFWTAFPAFFHAVFALERYQWAGVGLLVCFFVGLAARGAVIQFMEVAVHELIHAIVGLPFRGQPVAIAASSDSGGVTVWTSSAAAFIVRLAPYCFPLLTILVLPLRWFLAPRFSWGVTVFDILLGATLAFHYTALAMQLNPIQSDFVDVGFPAAVGIALTCQLAWLVIVMGVIVGDLLAVRDFFLNTIAAVPPNYAVAVDLGRPRLLCGRDQP